jgi:methylamine---glutamate N-methyltransferase subunit A
MCGIVGFWDKTGTYERTSGRIILTMLKALACRGPDSAGIALLCPEAELPADEIWHVRIAPPDTRALERLACLGELVLDSNQGGWQRHGDTLRCRFRPEPGVTPRDLEQALGARRGGIEVLSLGRRLDLVKQVGSPDALEATYAVSCWNGPLGIGHTRMSTESRIDLSHSQPFGVHGTLDLATVHNGHITNYHQLRRRYEQQGVTFYTENDSEVIGVYLRRQMDQGQSLPEAMASSIDDLDGSFNYLVIAPDGLGVVRDRFGFKPLVLAETDELVAVATEEIALRHALALDFQVSEPPPGAALFYSLKSAQPVLALA